MTQLNSGGSNPPSGHPGNARGVGNLDFWPTLSRNIAALWNIGNFWLRWLILIVAFWPVLLIAVNFIQSPNLLRLMAFFPTIAILAAILIWIDPILLGIIYAVDRRLVGILPRVSILLAIYSGMALFMSRFPIGIGSVLVLLVAIQGLLFNRIGGGPRRLNTTFWIAIVTAALSAIYEPTRQFINNHVVNWIEDEFGITKQVAWAVTLTVPMLALLFWLRKNLIPVIGEKGAKWVLRAAFILGTLAVYQVLNQPTVSSPTRNATKQSSPGNLLEKAEATVKRWNTPRVDTVTLRKWSADNFRNPPPYNGWIVYRIPAGDYWSQPISLPRGRYYVFDVKSKTYESHFSPKNKTWSKADDVGPGYRSHLIDASAISLRARPDRDVFIDASWR